MPPLPELVEQGIRRHRLLLDSQPLVVGVSGGLDSLVLLHILVALAPRHHWRLTVAHFNHRLRGQASDADSAWVQRLARRLQLPCIVDSADVATIARRERLSVEMAARQLRHAFLAGAARQAGSQRLALAHQADDQVELFFLRWLRGASPEGLAGMRPLSPSPADPEIQIARPLLTTPRQTIAAYARTHRLRPRPDITNDSPDYLRNRIRHELLPLLERRYQPAVRAVTARTMELLAAEDEFVAQAANSWSQGGPRRALFDSLPLALQRRVLVRQLRQLGFDADFCLVESLRTRARVAVSLAPGVTASRETTGVVRVRPQPRSQFISDECIVRFAATSGSLTFGGLQFRWRRSPSPGSHHLRLRPQPQREQFDATRVGDCIRLRHWRPGDRFQPLGFAAPSKLQDLFTNAKVPREERRRRVLATTAANEILWVEGLPPGERFKIRPDTRRRLVWQWCPS